MSAPLLNNSPSLHRGEGDTVDGVTISCLIRQVIRDIFGSMKRVMMDILVCLVCKGKLELTVDKEEKEKVVAGSLYCPGCNATYPIVDTIPNLLPPEKAG